MISLAFFLFFRKAVWSPLVDFLGTVASFEAVRDVQYRFIFN